MIEQQDDGKWHVDLPGVPNRYDYTPEQLAQNWSEAQMRYVRVSQELQDIKLKREDAQ